MKKKRDKGEAKRELLNKKLSKFQRIFIKAAVIFVSVCLVITAVALVYLNYYYSNPTTLSTFPADQQEGMKQEIIDLKIDLNKNPKERSEDWLNLATKQEKIGDDWSAVRTYKKALSFDSGNMTMHLNLGNAYMRLGKYNSAEKELIAAKKLDAGERQVYRGFYDLYFLFWPSYIMEPRPDLSLFGRVAYRANRFIERIRWGDPEMIKKKALGVLDEASGKFGDKDQDFIGLYADYYREMGNRDKHIEYLKKLYDLTKKDDIKEEIDKIESGKL